MQTGVSDQNVRNPPVNRDIKYMTIMYNIFSVQETLSLVVTGSVTDN